MFLGLWSNGTRVRVLVICVRIVTYNSCTTETFRLGFFIQFCIYSRAESISFVFDFLHNIIRFPDIIIKQLECAFKAYIYSPGGCFRCYLREDSRSILALAMSVINRRYFSPVAYNMSLLPAYVTLDLGRRTPILHSKLLDFQVFGQTWQSGKKNMQRRSRLVGSCSFFWFILRVKYSKLPLQIHC